MNKIIKIFSTPLALAESLALELVNQIKNAGKDTSTLAIALSGGSTPKGLFSVLGDKFAESVNWSNVHFFWVDERCVPPDDRESNFGMTNEVFLSKINIPKENVHMIRGEGDPEEETERYSQEIMDFTEQKRGLPLFRIMLLGLGEDGHTASIFPGNAELFRSEKICETAVHPVTGQKRITLTGKVINNAAQIIFMVTGKNKSHIIREIIEGGDSKKQFPASNIIPVEGKIFWYLDEAAASLIKKL